MEEDRVFSNKKEAQVSISFLPMTSIFLTGTISLVIFAVIDVPNVRRQIIDFCIRYCTWMYLVARYYCHWPNVA